MAITKKEILKLGNLAKIGISDSEMKELEDQLNKILNFVDQINQGSSVKSQDAESKHLWHSSTLRPDEVTDISNENDILSNSPSSYEGLITVPLVIE